MVFHAITNFFQQKIINFFVEKKSTSVILSPSTAVFMAGGFLEKSNFLLLRELVAKAKVTKKEFTQICHYERYICYENSIKYQL